MAWHWSHTAEALQNARANLEELEYSDLLVIYAEIVANRGTGRDDVFDEGAYMQAWRLAADSGMTAEQLADSIWESMEQLALCDNGGHNAWCCPYGCHTVSFGRGD